MRVVVPYLTSVKVVEVPTLGFAWSVGVTSVFGSIFSENVPVTIVLRATFVALRAGLALVTVGAVLSTVIVTELEAEEVLPAASVAVAVSECSPSLRALLGVKVQLPELSVLAVPSLVLLT